MNLGESASISDIKKDNEFKSLYNIFVNNYLYNDDNKNILLKNVIDLNLIIHDLKFDLNNNIKINKKLDTILELDTIIELDIIIENDDL